MHTFPRILKVLRFRLLGGPHPYRSDTFSEAERDLSAFARTLSPDARDFVLDAFRDVSDAIRRRGPASREDGEVEVRTLDASYEAVSAFCRLGALAPFLDAHGVFLRQGRGALLITPVRRPPAGSLGEVLRRNGVIAARRLSKMRSRDRQDRNAYRQRLAAWVEEQEGIADELKDVSGERGARYV